MLNSLEEIAALLEGTELEASTKIELVIPDSPDCAFAIKVDNENHLRAWNILRALIDRTERYPVLSGENHLSSDEWIEHFTERDPFDSKSRDISPEAIIEEAKRIDLAQELAQEHHSQSYLSLEEAIDLGIEHTFKRFGIAPSREAIFTYYSNNPISNRVDVEVQKWLFDWEREHLDPDIALASPDPWYLYLTSYIPSDIPEYSHSLILLPTVNSWEALAYMPWLGVYTSNLMTALLQSWHKRFKAELVINDGWNLLFNVHQRPATPEVAFQLAVEQEAFAGDTLYLSGISIRDHARALLHLDRWHLFSKP